jgi:asparaginyl-tRNA synthetase
MDVLAPEIGEMIGGSQREEQLAALDARMAECRIDQKHYAWYRDLRKLRHGAACRLRPPRPGFRRGHPRLRHRPRQRPRTNPLPANPRQPTVLTRTA